jgi:predicted DNA-binding protein
MGALTVRLPDDKHQRLKALAKTRGAPLNRLIDEMTTLMLAEFDAETRFRLRAQNGAGKAQRGLELLNQLDAHFSQKTV